MTTPKAPVTELSNTVPAFVDDLCSVETIGGVTHLVFTSTRRQLYSPHDLERVVEARLIVPADRIDAMARAMLAGRVEAEAIEEHATLN